ncbi:NAD(P)/FAD-dependent oxidoreductase [Pedobacter africanus]|uniref:Thioredoxin reductase n=1 Tax=Pedobacter africanus TaxID=151894 RepID=A0A1W2CXE6_9SPHI|nr:NAD(P)/FAD-dependent oxidoreductase [Pedobacter africanus]SMC89877.1 Thioredoxin reductase [Pedobacter africanus]
MKYDVIIIGGSYAGLSAAMSLGRTIRKVLVIDEDKPCNQQTPHSHNFLTQDGSTPAAIAALGREQVLKYPTVAIQEGRAIGVKGTDGNFEVSTAAGEQFYAGKLIFATGIKDIMPGIPGFSDCWGISVIHCPYCHGYEYKTQQTGILINSDMVADFAGMIRNLTDKLTVFTDGIALISKENQQRLGKMDVKIDERKIEQILHNNGNIGKLVFKDGTFMLDALYARLPFEQHCSIPETLGCNFTDMGFIQVNDLQKTSVAGVFAAGDNVTPFRSVAAAVAAGSKAGAAVNHELVAEKVW